MSFVRLRSLLFGRYLLATNTVSCGVLMGLGDLTVQSLERVAEDSHKPYDWARTGRMCTLGIVLGPCNHVWYTFLDRILPRVNTSSIIRKILLDQICASPFFAFTFFIGMGTLEGQHFRNSWLEFRSKFWTVYKADWTVWPAAQAVNFYLLPSHLRVIYVGFITLCWNTFLSYMKHRDQTSLRKVPTISKAKVSPG